MKLRKSAGGVLIPGIEPVLIDLHPGRRTNYARELGLPENIYVPIAGGASKSDYLENKDLDHNLGKTSFTMPSTVALALLTVTPTDSSTGSSVTEANYTGYARKAVAGSDLNAGSAGQTTSANTLTFAACTAGSSTIIAWILCDSSTTGAGNALYWGTATSTVISTTQTPATIASGGLVVNED